MSSVKDGASLRLQRLRSMMSYISSTDGPSTNDILSYMMLMHGLKMETTGRYLAECSKAGWIREKVGRWYPTDRWERLMGAMFSSE